MNDKKILNDEMIDALGMIDDTFLIEAEEIDSAEKLKALANTDSGHFSTVKLIRRVSSLAACIIVILAVISLLPHINLPGLPIGEESEKQDPPVLAPAESSDNETRAPAISTAAPIVSSPAPVISRAPESMADVAEPPADDAPNEAPTPDLPEMEQAAESSEDETEAESDSPLSPPEVLILDEVGQFRSSEYSKKPMSPGMYSFIN